MMVYLETIGSVETMTEVRNAAIALISNYPYITQKAGDIPYSKYNLQLS
jgi:hypothetical protein